MSEQELDGTPESRVRISRGPAAEVVMAGEIDLTNTAAVHDALEEAGRGGGALTLDLVEVTYLASAGVAELFQQAETNELTILVAAGSAIEKVLRVCGMEVVATVQVLPAPPAAH